MIAEFLTRAFTYFGVWLPLVLHAAFGIAAAWAAMPILPNRLSIFVIAALVVQPVLFFVPDPTQALLLICAILMLGSLAREQEGLDPPLRCGIEGGIWAGLALSIHVIFLPVILGITALFALFWLVTGNRNTLRALEGLALGLFVIIAIAIGVTQGEHWATEREVTTISLPYGLAAAINCGMWGVLTGYARAHSLARRVILFCLTGLGALFALHLFAPELLA